MSKAERGADRTIDILWRENPWEGSNWVRFRCPRPGEDATLAFPRCLTCGTFVEVMRKSGLKSLNQITDTFRDMVLEEIEGFKRPSV